MPKIKKTRIPPTPATPAIPYVRGFKKPSLRAIERALGHQTATYSEEEFPGLPRPQHQDDWLAQYKESGQTVAQFLQFCPWLGGRKVSRYPGEFNGREDNVTTRYPGGRIYLVEVGGEGRGESVGVGGEVRGRESVGVGGKGRGESVGVDMEQLENYCSTFLQISVSSLPSLTVERRGEGLVVGGRRLQCRQQGGRRQLATSSLLQVLRDMEVPTDCLLLLAVTMFDLYQEKEDLFIAGLAQGNRRVAVFSFYRSVLGNCAEFCGVLGSSGEFWGVLVSSGEFL